MACAFAQIYFHEKKMDTTLEIQS